MDTRLCKAEPQESCGICFSLDYKTQECEDYAKPTVNEPSSSKQAKRTSPNLPQVELGGPDDPK